MSQPTNKLFEVYALITVAALVLLVLSCFRDQSRLPDNTLAAQLAIQRTLAMEPMDSANIPATQTNTASFPIPQHSDR